MMRYSHEEITRFQAKFALKRKRQIILTLIMIPLAFAYAFEHIGVIGRIFGIPGEVYLVIFFLLLIPAYCNCSCPACKRMFGRHGGLNLANCRYCGIPLREDHSRQG
jgi:hypothetical protein